MRSKRKSARWAAILAARRKRKRRLQDDIVYIVKNGVLQ